MNNTTLPPILMFASLTLAASFLPRLSQDVCGAARGKAKTKCHFLQISKEVTAFFFALPQCRKESGLSGAKKNFGQKRPKKNVL